MADDDPLLEAVRGLHLAHPELGPKPLHSPSCGSSSLAKPEWWNDEGLKALSARVMRAARHNVGCNMMRAHVLCGQLDAWESGPRSAAELREAAAHFDRAAALHSAPAVKAEFADCADVCRRRAAEALQIF